MSTTAMGYFKGMRQIQDVAGYPSNIATSMTFGIIYQGASIESWTSSG
jgi:hypothetical protein